MTRVHLYHVYILICPSRTSLYVGVTNDIVRRLTEHRGGEEAKDLNKFTGRYNCIHLVYVENFQWVQDAIAREKEIKGWVREKKMNLIRAVNPEMRFLEGDW